MTQTTFQDVFKTSFLELMNYGELSYQNVLISLVITSIIGLFIMQIYKMTFDGVVYQPSFATSILLIALVTTMIIMTISSNVVLSLGMVGALSIVRFRAAIKDPKDIGFMFWAIAIGISTGASLYMIATIGSLFIGIVLLLLNLQKTVIRRFILVVKFDEEESENVYKILDRIAYELKTKVVTNNDVELTLELNKIGINTAFVNELSKLSGVKNAMLVHYSGEYIE